MRRHTLRGLVHNPADHTCPTGIANSFCQSAVCCYPSSWTCPNQGEDTGRERCCLLRRWRYIVCHYQILTCVSKKHRADRAVPCMKKNTTDIEVQDTGRILAHT